MTKLSKDLRVALGRFVVDGAEQILRPYFDAEKRAFASLQRRGLVFDDDRDYVLTSLGRNALRDISAF